MGKDLFEYFYGRQQDLFAFYRVPKALVTEPEFSGLSDRAKFLYGLLLDRMSLSSRNGWLDEEGRVFIIYTVEDVKHDLQCSKNTAVKLLFELEEFGLIEKRRPGCGKPNIIYVKCFLPDPKKSTSGIPVSGIQESQFLGCNKTDMNKTENNISSFPFLPEAPAETEQKDRINEREGKGNETEARRVYREIIMDNICYGRLLEEDPSSREIIDEILDLIVDVVCTNAGHIRVARDDKPAEVVRSQFLKLDPEHIKLVVENLRKNTTKIRNMRQYLTASLYNAPMTIGNYYRSLVSHDLSES